jgi:hypothetical protein
MSGRRKRRRKGRVNGKGRKEGRKRGTFTIRQGALKSQDRFTEEVDGGEGREKVREGEGKGGVIIG